MAQALGLLSGKNPALGQTAFPTPRPGPRHLCLTMTGWRLPRNLVNAICIRACWRVGMASTMSFSVTSLEVGGGFRMVDGPLGIQAYQSSCS